MNDLLKTNLGRLRIIGFLEGISYLLLLGVAMPLKYIANEPQATKIIGMAHGILFILYVVLLLIVKLEKNWNLRIAFWAFIASLLPFGTFVADKKYFRLS